MKAKNWFRRKPQVKQEKREGWNLGEKEAPTKTFQNKLKGKKRKRGIVRGEGS